MNERERKKLTETRTLKNPSHTTCPATVAVILALWPAHNSASAKTTAAAFPTSVEMRWNASGREAGEDEDDVEEEEVEVAVALPSITTPKRSQERC